MIQNPFSSTLTKRVTDPTLKDINPFFDTGLRITKAASKLDNTLEILPK
jgi:hypothetical protein